MQRRDARQERQKRRGGKAEPDNPHTHSGKV
jgi:hypothetical protein